MFISTFDWCRPALVAAPLTGALSDRWKNRWAFAVGGLVLGAASMLSLTLDSVAAVLFGIACAAVVRGTLQAMATALNGDLANQEQWGRAIGLVHTASDLGSALGPVVAYALLPRTGLKGVYWVCAALFAVELAMNLLFQAYTKRVRLESTCSVRVVEQ